MSVTGMPISNAEIAVHLPVPFYILHVELSNSNDSHLPSHIANLVNHWRSVDILEPEDIARDFNQKGIQFTAIPFGKDGRHLIGGLVQTVAHQLVGFANQLHIAVFDAIVHHLIGLAPRKIS
jgi:hypothetical protein